MKKLLLLAAVVLAQGGATLLRAQDELPSIELAQKILPTNFETNYFGWSSAMSDDNLFIGQYQAAGTSGAAKVGRVLVYNKTADGWAIADTIVSPIQVEGASFGYSVATDGKRLAVGATEMFSTNSYLKSFGFVSIYVKGDDGKWSCETSSPLRQSSNTSGYFGYCVAIDGDVAVAGAPFAKVSSKSGVGSAAILVRGESGWTVVEQASPVSGSANYFGRAVAVSDGTVVIGAAKGAPWRYTLTDGTWSKSIVLPVVYNESSNAASIALDGSTMMIANVDNGLVQVYNRAADGSWSGGQAIQPGISKFGYIVVMKGDNAVITINNGNAYLYKNVDGTWMAKGVMDYIGSGANGTTGQMGYAASINSTQVAIDAPQYPLQNSEGAWTSGVGAVFVYNLGGTETAITPITTVGEAEVYATTGGIVVSAPQPTQVAVYGIDGRIAATLTTGTDRTKVSLPTGVYVVRAAGKCCKVVVR